MKAKKPENVLVVYQACDETLVCLKKDEKRLIKEFFTESSSRELISYDRYESESAHPVVWVTAVQDVKVTAI